MRRDVLALLICLCSLAAAIPCSAQEYEIAPFVGGFFPGKFAGLIEVDKEGMYGIKGGYFLTHHVEAEAQFGYINNLSFKDTLTRKKAYIGEVTTTVSDDTRSLFDPSILTSDHFLSLSYGGGIKALRRWGPFGFRAELR